MEGLEATGHRLADAGVKLHLSEVKGTVMDALERSHLLEDAPVLGDDLRAAQGVT